MPTLRPSCYPSTSPSTLFIITTFAGSDISSDAAGDGGAATSADLNSPYGVSLDSIGNVYIADTGNNRVRKVTVSTGIITTIAGTGVAGYSGDGGSATAANIYNPLEIFVDSNGIDYLTQLSRIRILLILLGDVYIPEFGSNRVRKVAASSGIISLIAGSGGTGSYSGDGGAATAATLYSPFGVTIDSSGNVYIGDTYNLRVRKVTISTGVIATYAGSGCTTDCAYNDGGAATSAFLYYPAGVALDASGSTYSYHYLSYTYSL